MSDLSSLLSFLRPPASEVARHLGLEPYTDSRGLHVECPFCRGRLHLSEAALICSNRQCSWLAGNIVDFVKDAKGMHSYSQALTWVVESLGNFYDDAFTSNAALVGRVGSGLRRQRQLFRELYTSMRGNPENAWMSAWLNNAGIAPEAVDLTMLRASWPALQKLAQLLDTYFDGAGQHIRRMASQAAFVIPYGPVPGWTSVLLIFNPKTKQMADIRLEEHAFQFSGLLQGMPWLRPMLCDSFLTAAAINSQNQQTRPEFSAVSVFYQRAAAGRSLVSPMHRPVYALDVHGQEGPALAGALRGNAPGLTYTTVDEAAGATHLRERDWPEAMANLLQAHSDADGLLPAGRACLRSVYLHEAEQVQIAALLRRRGRHRAAQHVETLVGELTVLHQGKTALVSKPTGYELRDGNKPPEMITNFTALPTGNVAFLQTQDICHELKVHFDGNYYRVLIPRKHLEIASELEKAVQMAVTRMRKGSTTSTLPVILSRSAFKYPIRHWKERIAITPNRSGITGLGWTPDRKEFILPDGVINMDGYRRDAFVFHPNTAMFDHFLPEDPGNKSEALRMADKPITLDEIRALSPAQLMVTSMFLALILRPFLHRQATPANLQQDHRLQNFLEAAFRELRQVRGVMAFAGLTDFAAGYPIYGYSNSTVMAASVAGPAIIMSPGGVHCPLTDADAAGAEAWGKLMQRMLRQTVHWILSSSEIQMPMFRHIFPSSQLQREGEWMLREMFQTDQVPASVQLPYATIERYFGMMRDNDDISARMRHDVSAQRVRMSCTGFDDVDDLELEMRVLFGNSVERKESRISADASRVLGAMQQFYGYYPRLSTVSEA